MTQEELTAQQEQLEMLEPITFTLTQQEAEETIKAIKTSQKRTQCKIRYLAKKQLTLKKQYRRRKMVDAILERLGIKPSGRSGELRRAVYENKIKMYRMNNKIHAIEIIASKLTVLINN